MPPIPRLLQNMSLRLTIEPVHDVIYLLRRDPDPRRRGIMSQNFREKPEIANFKTKSTPETRPNWGKKTEAKNLPRTWGQSLL